MVRLSGQTITPASPAVHRANPATGGGSAWPGVEAETVRTTRASSISATRRALIRSRAMIQASVGRPHPTPPRLLALLVAAVACATACSGPPPAPAWPPAGGRGSCTVSKTSDVGVPMRDGTELRADVYRPTTADPVPVILYRTQYNKVLAQIQPSRYQSPDWFASHCYLVVTEDIRGLYASAGAFSEYTNDQNDGYDSVEWVARLPGSNGRVGMYGSSYVGATQWLAAEAAPPHLVTIVPSNTSADYYQGWTYEDGAFRLNFIEPWLMGLAEAAAMHRGDQATANQLDRDRKNPARLLTSTPYQRFAPLQPDNPAVAGYFFDWLRNRTDGPFWAQWAPQQFYPRINIPVLNMEGWYDGFLAGGVQNFTGMVASAGSPFARANQRLVIGPYDHLGWGRPESPGAPLLKDIGPIANSPVNDLMIAWWDHYLKGVDNGIGSGGPRVDYFRMGSNTWQTTTAWPLPGTQTTPYYLASGGHANTAGGDGRMATTPPGPTSPPDHYRYDPADPVHSVGGHSCCSAGGVGSQGPYDQREVEQRPDVLTYTTDALTQDTEVTGPISLTLFAVSSAPDTDWTAKLVVVHPDGAAVNLNNGIQRASYRDSLSKPSPITPGP